MANFKFKVKTDETTSYWYGGTSSGVDQFYLPLRTGGFSYNCTVYWGDATSEVITTGGDHLHTYPAPGTYEITIDENVVGGFPAIYFYQKGDHRKIIEITAWGTNHWLTMSNAFYFCDRLTISATDGATADTASSPDWTEAFKGCSALTHFPAINTTGATNLKSTWENCYNIVTFDSIDTSNCTNFLSTWAGCNSLINFFWIDVSSSSSLNGPSLESTWSRCYSLESFPVIDTSAIKVFTNTWFGCRSLTSFPLLDTSQGERFNDTWDQCSSLTSFPLLDTGNGIYFNGTWAGCSSLTSFPFLDFSNGTSFYNTWNGCSSLTSFPLFDFSTILYLEYTWANCSGLTSFPYIDLSSCTSVKNAWRGCTGLTSFPLLDFSNIIYFDGAWSQCRGLSNFPMIDVSSGASFYITWEYCSGLTSFPALEFSASPWNFRQTWKYCTGLTEFPSIKIYNTNALDRIWEGCENITTFHPIDTSNVTGFVGTWMYCKSLKSLSGFDFSAMTDGSSCFEGVELDTNYVDSLLQDLSDNNLSNNTIMHFGASYYTSAGKVYKDLLEARNWNIMDVGEVPTIDFSIGDPKIVESSIDFTNESDVYPYKYDYYTYISNTWNWDFGNGDTTSVSVWPSYSGGYYIVPIESTTYSYPAGGSFTTTLDLVKNVRVYQRYTGEFYNYIRTFSQTAAPITVIAPVADFVGTPVRGYSPLAVHYTDLSSDNPTSWDWDFGDGSPHSTEQNPTHTYNYYGFYTVTLTPYWESYSTSITKTQYVSVVVKHIPEIYSDGGGFSRLRGPSLIFD